MVTHGNQAPNLEQFHSDGRDGRLMIANGTRQEDHHLSVGHPISEVHETSNISELSPESLIQLVDVGKAFGSRLVLNRLSLQVARGEFLAVIGRSGCGKTTLLRLLAGLESPTTGSAHFAGVPIRSLNDRARIMFQDARLLPWLDVLGNVQLGLQGKAKERAADLLADVGLGDRARSWPNTLSGGQRQRVSLARALAHSPDLLLLDEPLASVDALTRLEMQSLIEQLWLKREMAIILVTHDVEEAIALADRVVILDRGSLRADIKVSLPRPRSRLSLSFTQLEESVYQQIVGHSKQSS